MALLPRHRGLWVGAQSADTRPLFTSAPGCLPLPHSPRPAPIPLPAAPSQMGFRSQSPLQDPSKHPSPTGSNSGSSQDHRIRFTHRIKPFFKESPVAEPTGCRSHKFSPHRTGSIPPASPSAPNRSLDSRHSLQSPAVSVVAGFEEQTKGVPLLSTSLSLRPSLGRAWVRYWDHREGDFQLWRGLRSRD